MAERRGLGWVIGAAVLAAGAAAFAVVSFLSLSSARRDRDEALEALAAAEQEVADTRDALSDATAERITSRGDLTDAEAAVAGAEQALGDAEHREFLQEVAEQQAGVAGPRLLEAAAAYPDLAAAVVAAIEDHLATAEDLADVRADQAEAVAAGHYRTFNTLQARYNALVDDYNEEGDAVAAAMAALPAFDYRGVASSEPPPAPTHVTVIDGDLDPPTGPARIEGSFPESIPCTPRSDGCRWNWEITFTETNALTVIIERLGIRYTDRRGAVWVSQSGEWRDVSIIIPALGTKTWDSWVQSLDPDSEGNLQGATLQVRWEGTDGEGNSITGRARVSLEWRESD